jgi:hypothetical protein
MTREETLAILRERFGKYFPDTSLNIWLSFPHPDLGERTPMKVIEEGRGQCVVDMIEAAIAGEMT